MHIKTSCKFHKRELCNQIVAGQGEVHLWIENCPDCIQEQMEDEFQLQEDCKHVYGVQGDTIDGGFSRRYDNSAYWDIAFDYCPRCGKKL